MRKYYILLLNGHWEIVKADDFYEESSGTRMHRFYRNKVLILMVRVDQVVLIKFRKVSE